MATGLYKNTHFIEIIGDEDEDGFRIPLENNTLKESYLYELFPQAVGLYYKDETNTKTIVIKKDNCFIAPVDGSKGFERKYHQIKKKEQNNKEKIRSLADAIRAENQSKRSPSVRKQPFQPPSTKGKHKQRIDSDIVSVRFQWTHYNENKYASQQGYKQVYQSDGGGLREFPMDRNVGFKEIFLKAKEIYFPDGHSPKGKLEDMEFSLTDFTLKPIKAFTNQDGTESNYKDHLTCRGLFPSRSSVFLMTRKRVHRTVTVTSDSDGLVQKTGCSKSTEEKRQTRKFIQQDIDPELKRKRNLPKERATKLVVKDQDISNIYIRYTKEKHLAHWDSVSMVTVTGRKQALELLFLSDETGELHRSWNDTDPLDHDYKIKYIKKDEKVYLDTEVQSTNYLKETVVGMDTQEHRFQLNEERVQFVFPQAAGMQRIITHGTKDIIGYDDDELVIGVICKDHGSRELNYRWFKDSILIKCGVENNLIRIGEAGRYYCVVEKGGDKEKSDEVIVYDAKSQSHTQRAASTSQIIEGVSSVPIIPLAEVIFSISHEIGKGAFARVYKGTWIGSTVAIKVIELKKRSQSKIKTMVDEEIKINCKIRHPNIVQLMAVAYDCHGINLVTEFINGFNMEDLIFDEETKRKANLNLSNKLFIRTQCLQAVSYLHRLEKAIIHRDIKPANILVDGQSFITKLCDLGVSRVKSYTSYSLTNLGQPGTPGYMAPEILLEGKSATLKGDIWAIGISLIELFAEEEAWGELDSYEEIKTMLQKGEPPRALALTKIPEPINNILRGCVMFNPDVRPNALEVLLSIKRFV